MRRFVVASLAACAVATGLQVVEAQTPATATPPDKAQVYVYRPLLMYPGARPFSVALPDLTYDTAVHVDGVQLVVLKSGGRYVEFALEPGVHKFFSDSRDDELTIRLEPNIRYYLRLETHASMTKARGVLIPLEAQYGAHEYERTAVAAGKAKKERGKLRPQPLDRQPPTAEPQGEPPITPDLSGSDPWHLAAPAGRALLVFYRNPGPKIDISEFSVFVDGKQVADLDDGSYVAVAVEPGEHRLHTGKLDDEFTLDLAASVVYFVRLGSKPSPMGRDRGEMVVFERRWGEKDFLARLAGIEKNRALTLARKVLVPELVVPLPPP